MRIEYSKSGNVVYTVDEESGIITAKILCQVEDPQLAFDSQLFKHICGEGLGPVQEADTFAHKYRINSEYIGKAKCHPDDRFDIDFGKRLALLRAKQKYLRAMETKLLDIYCWMERLLGRANVLYVRQFRKLVDNNSELYAIESRAGRK